DRRTSLVTLTPAGRARFETIAAAHEQWVATLFRGLDGGESAMLVEIYERLLLQRRDGSDE
ncbi:MAG: MarR family winged helix-turn-helix transcriptional regulator, partial [Beijerinckiaceae bacterium]